MLPLDQIVTGDCVAKMNGMPAGSVDLVFADPPFNIGYLYSSYDDEKTCDEYLAFSEKWMKAVHRVLKPSGSFFLAIGDEYAADLTVIARRKLGFNMRNWIIWHYTFGQQTKKMFAKSHTH
ncbi:MAG: site-specific DNA-methyltransferase, partial [Chlorobia bacterium]|nr:site-specific DNA-methyltransferase [Fimbriimonadaceae bacterium]